MKNVFRAAVPASLIVVGILVLFEVGAGATSEGGLREFAGALLIAIGILAEIAVWTHLWVRE